jgi:Response regulator containing CheY-like receiver domain and AraC-type DNA-binding domain
MYHFNGEHFDSYENILDSYEQLIGLFQNAHEMVLFLKAFSAENKKPKPCLSGEEPGSDTYKRILNYLDTQYFNDISVQSIAYRMQINPNYISQLFKKERGETFTEYLTGIRVRHACSMLKSSVLPIYEIAEKVGYKDYFHFAKVFKKITGRTPTAYRDSN